MDIELKEKLEESFTKLFDTIKSYVDDENSMKELLDKVIATRTNNDFLLQLKVDYDYSDIISQADFRVKVKFVDKYFTSQRIEAKSSIDYTKLLESKLTDLTSYVDNQFKSYGLIGFFGSTDVKQEAKDRYSAKFTINPKVVAKKSKKNNIAKLAYELLLAKDPNIINEEDNEKSDSNTTAYGKLTSVLNEYFNYDCKNDIKQAFETCNRDTITLNIFGYKWNEKYDEDSEVEDSLSVNVMIRPLNFKDFKALNDAIEALDLPYPYTKEEQNSLIDNMAKFTEILAEQIRKYGYKVKEYLTPDIDSLEKAITFTIQVTKE